MNGEVEYPGAEPADKDGLEGAVRVLLSSAYKPPVPRAEFKNELFGRLKKEQAAVAERRRRKQKIRVLSFATGLAAAASVMLMLAVTGDSYSEGVSSSPANVTGSSIAQNSMQAKVAGKLEVLGEGGVWKRAAGDITVAEGAHLRTRGGQAGITFRDGVRVVMDRNSEFRVVAGSLNVEHGLMRIQMPEKADSMRVELPEHELSLRGGTSVQVAVQDSEKFAPGGQPAPDVTVLAGTAMVKPTRGSVSPVSLLAGRKYQLHNYQRFASIGGERLDERVMDDQNRWLKPQLVRLLTEE